MLYPCCRRIIYDKDEGKLTLERDRFEDRTKEVREVEIEELQDLHIFIDASSIEIFVNGGREVFTARYFPSREINQSPSVVEMKRSLN